MKEWDPIGVKEARKRQTNTTSTLMTSTNIARQATLSKLSEYLRWVEVERVGVVDEQRSTASCREHSQLCCGSLMALLSQTGLLWASGALARVIAL
jgi:C1A family cysteine protease